MKTALSGDAAEHGGSPEVNRQWLLAERPEGALLPRHFVLQRAELPKAGPGQALLRLRAISVEPAQRVWIKMPTYRPQLQPGDVMAAIGLAEVVESCTPELKPGDLVEGDFGWQDFTVVTPGQVHCRDATLPLEQLIGVLSIPGFAAYFGLLDVGRPLPGETVVVSAAAGAVGCIAVQLAKLAGCRVVAVAGGADKCRWLTEELGADAAVDYKSGSVQTDLQAACPQGVDVYFDNTGGAVLDAALALMNLNGRVVCCGAVSQYDQGAAGTGPSGMPGVLIRKRIRMEGFIVFDHYGRRKSAESALTAWLQAGVLKAPIAIVDGLENAPQALIDLLNGRHRGKMMIRVS